MQMHRSRAGQGGQEFLKYYMVHRSRSCIRHLSCCLVLGMVSEEGGMEMHLGAARWRGAPTCSGVSSGHASPSGFQCYKKSPR